MRPPTSLLVDGQGFDPDLCANLQQLYDQQLGTALDGDGQSSGGLQRLLDPMLQDDALVGSWQGAADVFFGGPGENLGTPNPSLQLPTKAAAPAKEGEEGTKVVGKAAGAKSDKRGQARLSREVRTIPLSLGVAWESLEYASSVVLGRAR